MLRVKSSGWITCMRCRLFITPSINLRSYVRVTVSILEDDLIVLKEQLRHDVRILPVEPQWSLC